ncbi:MAG: hypothetical protein ACK5M7_14580 [Draconibacterium sp.]
MKSEFLIRTIKIGIFFILPLSIVVIIFLKVIHLLNPFAHIIAQWLGHNANVMVQDYLITIVLLLLILFLGGVVEGKFQTSKKLILWIENNILAMVPAYQLIKNVNQDSFGGGELSKLKVVLAPIDGWMIAFQVEDIDEEMAMLFVPGSPSPYSGNLVIFRKSELRKTDLTVKEAYTILRQAGVNSATMLKHLF